MPVDQRCDEQRIDIARPVELLDPDVGLGVTGYTKNLSPSGLRARLDVAPTPGNNLQLAINLADGTSPLETQGEVMWCVPDSRGEGAEIGLRFTCDPVAAPINMATVSEHILEIPTVRLGQRLRLDTVDKIIDVSVEEIVQDDAHPKGTLQLNLSVLGERPSPDRTEGPETDDDLLSSAELWKPHPIRDLRNWFQKYLGPVIIVATAITIVCLKFLGSRLKKAFSLLPERFQRPISAFLNRFDFRLKVLQITQKSKEFSSRLRTKIDQSQKRHLSN